MWIRTVESSLSRCKIKLATIIKKWWDVDIFTFRLRKLNTYWIPFKYGSQVIIKISKIIYKITLF
jgi:hypothetical protein